MILFNKNASDKAVVKKDTLILDYLKKNEKDIDNFQALYLFIHKLQNQSMRSMQRQSLIETFENVTKKSGGELFGMPNDDMVIIFNKRAHEEILACLVKIRFLFHGDPLIRDADDLQQVGFAKFFSLDNGIICFLQAKTEMCRFCF